MNGRSLACPQHVPEASLSRLERRNSLLFQLFAVLALAFAESFV
jgi:hypothetical protein